MATQANLSSDEERALHALANNGTGKMTAEWWRTEHGASQRIRITLKGLGLVRWDRVRRVWEITDAGKAAAGVADGAGLETVADRIKRLRALRYLRPIDAANAAGISRQRWYQIESGAEPNMRLGTLLKIQAVLGCTLDELVTGTVEHARIVQENENGRKSIGNP
jgi:DNA-binding Xre family transcriptional regulator